MLSVHVTVGKCLLCLILQVAPCIPEQLQSGSSICGPALSGSNPPLSASCICQMMSAQTKNTCRDAVYGGGITGPGWLTQTGGGVSPFASSTFTSALLNIRGNSVFTGPFQVHYCNTSNEFLVSTWRY
jgi:hypothetical protein